MISIIGCKLKKEMFNIDFVLTFYVTYHLPTQQTTRPSDTQRSFWMKRTLCLCCGDSNTDNTNRDPHESFI